MSYPFKLPDGTTVRRDAAGDGTTGDPYRNRDILVHPTTGAGLIGRAAASSSLPVALSTEDYAALDGIETALAALGTQTTLAAVLAALEGALTVGLPTGAATAANQATLIGHVDGIEAALAALATQTTLASVLSALQGTLAVSAASLPLPSGAATAANQSTANTSLSSIDGKLAPRAAAAANIHAPASNTAAVVTYSAGGAGVSHVIGGIAWSYSGTPTSGNLKVEDGSGTTVLSLDITAAGPGFIPLDQPLRGSANTALIVTLAAGGSGVSGKVSVLSKWTV